MTTRISKCAWGYLQLHCHSSFEYELLIPSFSLSLSVLLSQMSERPLRAYSVGSRLEHSKRKFRMDHSLSSSLASNSSTSSRTRAYSVGSRAKMPRPDHYKSNCAGSPAAQIALMNSCVQQHQQHQYGGVAMASPPHQTSMHMTAIGLAVAADPNNNNTSSGTDKSTNGKKSASVPGLLDSGTTVAAQASQDCVGGGDHKPGHENSKSTGCSERVATTGVNDFMEMDFSPIGKIHENDDAAGSPRTGNTPTRTGGYNRNAASIDEHDYLNVERRSTAKPIPARTDGYVEMRPVGNFGGGISESPLSSSSPSSKHLGIAGSLSSLMMMNTATGAVNALNNRTTTTRSERESDYMEMPGREGSGMPVSPKSTSIISSNHHHQYHHQQHHKLPSQQQQQQIVNSNYSNNINNHNINKTSNNKIYNNYNSTDNTEDYLQMAPLCVSNSSNKKQQQPATHLSSNATTTTATTTTVPLRISFQTAATTTNNYSSSSSSNAAPASATTPSSNEQTPTSDSNSSSGKLLTPLSNSLEESGYLEMSFGGGGSGHKNNVDTGSSSNHSSRKQQGSDIQPQGRKLMMSNRSLPININFNTSSYNTTNNNASNPGNVMTNSNSNSIEHSISNNKHPNSSPVTTPITPRNSIGLLSKLAEQQQQQMPVPSHHLSCLTPNNNSNNNNSKKTLCGSSGSVQQTPTTMFPLSPGSPPSAPLPNSVGSAERLRFQNVGGAIGVGEMVMARKCLVDGTTGTIKLSEDLGVAAAAVANNNECSSSNSSDYVNCSPQGAGSLQRLLSTASIASSQGSGRDEELDGDYVVMNPATKVRRKSSSPSASVHSLPAAITTGGSSARNNFRPIQSSADQRALLNRQLSLNTVSNSDRQQKKGRLENGTTACAYELMRATSTSSGSDLAMSSSLRGSGRKQQQATMLSSRPSSVNSDKITSRISTLSLNRPNSANSDRLSTISSSSSSTSTLCEGGSSSSSSTTTLCGSGGPLDGSRRLGSGTSIAAAANKSHSPMTTLMSTTNAADHNGIMASHHPVVLSRPPSVTSCTDRQELHYASLDLPSNIGGSCGSVAPLAKQESDFGAATAACLKRNRNSTDTSSSSSSATTTPSPNINSVTNQPVPAFDYAQIDFDLTTTTTTSTTVGSVPVKQKP